MIAMNTQIVRALLPDAKIEVLKLLLLNPGQAFYQREIAERTGLRLRAVQQALRPLVEAGIITREARGRQVFYRADPSCPILRELTLILLKTVGLAEVLRPSLARMADRIQVAFVFGSMARGDATLESDVDLMVIGDVGLRDLVPTIRRVAREVGRDGNPITLKREELRERVKKGDAFLSRVLAGPKIFVVGSEDELRSLTAAGTPAKT
ncbi:MAG: nucleotidyltransferase domain-containing protein [Armatimonadetes bacterium]|nr:nucleotidyltransferase domain-containing protein [Armatimonadota bacterium]